MGKQQPKARNKPISLYPLSLEEALRRALKVKPPSKPATKKRSSSRSPSKGRASS